MSFYVSTATLFLLHCDEWDRVVALPRHKFVTGATLLQLGFPWKVFAQVSLLWLVCKIVGVQCLCLFWMGLVCAGSDLCPYWILTAINTCITSNFEIHWGRYCTCYKQNISLTIHVVMKMMDFISPFFNLFFL